MECEFSLRALVLVATLGSYQGLCWQGNAGNTYAASGTGFILGTRSDDSPPVFEFSYGQGVYPVVVESFVPDYLYVQTDVFATTTVTETSSTPLATFTSTIHPAQLLRTMVRLYLTSNDQRHADSCTQRRSRSSIQSRQRCPWTVAQGTYRDQAHSH